MKPIERLKLGLERVRIGWTTDAYSETSTGADAEFPWSPDAVQWCTVGALRDKDWICDPSYEEALDLLYRASESECTSEHGSFVSLGISLANWNDTQGRTQQDVIDLYREAITLAEEKEVT